MPRVHTWPAEWNKLATLRFYPSAANQTSPSPWVGKGSVYGPHVQLWRVEATLVPEYISDKWKAFSAFFAELSGQKELLRIGDVTRFFPQFDLEVAETQEPFSDGTRFTDGTGWIDGGLPPNVFVAVAAKKGDTSLVLGGLPASTPAALRPGDHIEVKRNGIQDETPSLHMVIRKAPTDAEGKTRIEFRPWLRKGVAAGDQVTLRGATGVFRCTDDAQGIVDISAPNVGNVGFSLVEAIL